MSHDRDGAVADFGAVAVVAPEYRRELGAAQGRRTTLWVLLTHLVVVAEGNLSWRVVDLWPGRGPGPMYGACGRRRWPTHCAGGRRAPCATSPARAFTCGAIAVAAPMTAILAGASEPLLTSMDASAVVTALVPPALAVTLLYQAGLWWLFRRPLDGRAAAFF